MYCATTSSLRANMRYSPRSDTPISRASSSGHSSGSQMYRSMNASARRNSRSCRSSAFSLALIAGRSRLTSASRVASLSSRLSPSWRADSCTRLLASTATGVCAAITSQLRTAAKRRLRSTTSRGRIRLSWRAPAP
ncbi:hypothetical protein D9M71_618990 [compost metagenome]